MPHIEAGRLYRGHGGEHTRMAVARLIRAASVFGLTVDTPSTAPQQRPGKRPTIRATLLATLEETLKHPNEEVQVAASLAVEQFLQVYFQNVPAAALDKLIGGWCEELRPAAGPFARRGYALALGRLPASISRGRLGVVVPALLTAMKLGPADEQDAESRRNAVNALGLLAHSTTSEEFGPHRSEIMHQMVEAGLQDYAVDKRGLPCTDGQVMLAPGSA